MIKLKDLLTENYYKDMAKDVMSIMKKNKITKVKDPDTRTWKTGSSNIWYKYSIDKYEFAYSIKPSMGHIYLYHKGQDENDTFKKLKDLAKQFKRAGLIAHPSKRTTGYMEYTRER
jgi:hypothetical protein